MFKCSIKPTIEYDFEKFPVPEKIWYSFILYFFLLLYILWFFEFFYPYFKHVHHNTMKNQIHLYIFVN